MTRSDSADDHGEGLWLVRIRDRGGDVLGGGTVLGTQHVLTCAHVVSAAADHRGAAASGIPDTEVMVEFPNGGGRAAIPARVEQDGWVEEAENGTGDVALLRLARRLPAGSGARLRQLSHPWGRTVKMLGFPESLEAGVFVDASLAGQIGEWVQLNSSSRSLHVRRGFSGSAVIDAADRAPIGMVVAKFEAFGLSWMMPVETIVRHLPAVRRWVDGHPAVAKPSATPARTHLEEAEPDPADHRRAADFLGARGVGGVMTIVTGEPGSPASAAINAAIAGLKPGVAETDLVLDATDRSVAELTEDLAEQLGIRPAADVAPGDLARAVPPMGLVVTHVDDAADPSRLMRYLLCPLAKRVVARDIRLLLGFRQAERSVPHRLILLRARLYEADAFVDLFRRLRGRIVLDEPDPFDPSALLANLARLHASRAPLPEIEQLERAVDDVLQAASRLRRRFAARLATRDELRRLLVVYQRVAAARGLAEDPQLGTLFRQAHRSLWSAPCDVAEAERLVGRYIYTVHSVPGEGVP